MRPLIPCSTCARHVRATDTECPFCGGELAVVEARPQPTQRLSRAAALVFGASVAVVGCGDETVIAAGSSSSSGGTTSSGSTSSGATTGGGQGGMGQGGMAQGGMGGQGGDGGSAQGGMGQGGTGQGGGMAPLYGASPPPPEE